MLAKRAYYHNYHQWSLNLLMYVVIMGGSWEDAGLSLEAITQIFEARAVSGIRGERLNNTRVLQELELPVSWRERNVATTSVDRS